MPETPIDADALPPVSAEAPCGPDLDAEGDRDFLNFMAVVEGQLPPSSDPKDQKPIELSTDIADPNQLLARSHDVRLLVLLAKVSIVNRDIKGFAHWLTVLANLLSNHWSDAHPRGEDGDFSARNASLSTLEYRPHVLVPLQYAVLAQTKRDGPLTFRALLFSLGELKPSDKEVVPNLAAIDKILDRAEIPRLAQTLQCLQSIKSSIARLRSAWVDNAGIQDSITFAVLTPLVDRIIAFVQDVGGQLDPNLAAPVSTSTVEASEGAAEAAPAAPTQFASLPDIDAALAAALLYFENAEPSSAAVLLIGQARNLLGRNLYEVMKVLAPNHADAARVFVGADASFTVPVNAIAANVSLAETFERAAPAPAASRAAAIALIESVATHLRRAEPSSPLPWLLDRARALASRDFISLLKDLLSEDIITQMKSGY
jgi:type VI secretion system protein ImpA